MTVVSASDNETVTGEPDININIDNDNYIFQIKEILLALFILLKKVQQQMK